MSEPHHDNYCLIPRSDNDSVLMLRTREGWTLPQHSAMEAPEINRAMREQLGLDVIVLRATYDRYKDEEREEQHIIYAMENLSPDATRPAQGDWISSEQLSGLRLAVPEHLGVLEAWFAERVSELVPGQRVPWARPGWYAEVVAWIMEQLSEYGYQLRTPVEQVHVRVWSCVLRVPTTGGDLYFKSASSAFAYEPALTAELAKLWPAFLPVVLAVDTERHWMLMEDAGVTLRKSEQGANVQTWENMLELFAHLQIDAAAHEEELLALGCPDRRLARLPALFDGLLDSREALLIGQEEGLSEEEYKQLRGMRPEVRALCAELAGYPIPETLHHDDFHSGNIMLKDGGYIFFDWAECALAHPFYTMIIVLRWTRHVLEFSEAERARLRDAYLAAWTRFAPMESLLRAFDLAQRLGLLCRALTWHATVSSLEEAERWAYADSVPWNLRCFLYYPQDLLT